MKVSIKCLVCKWRGMYCIKELHCPFRLRKLNEEIEITGKQFDIKVVEKKEVGR